MSGEAVPEKPEKLRWYQYRLRSLLILMTATAVLLGFISGPIRRHRQEKPAIEAVKKLANGEGSGVDFALDTAPGAGLLRRVLGEEVCLRVTRVNLAGCKLEDDDLKTLAAFDQLRSLSLARTGITDAGLAHLADLTSLETLDLSETQIQGEGLARLARLPRLEELDLGKTEVDDDGLKHLAAIGSLKRLRLDNTATSGEGLESIKRLSRLEILDLEGVQGIYDDDLAALQDLTSLRELNIGWARLAGPGLEHLKGLSNLEKVVIPSDVADLAALSRLQEVPSVVFDIWGKGRRAPGMGKECCQPYAKGDFPRFQRHMIRRAAGPHRTAAVDLWLGHGYRLLGEFDKAMECYRRALREADEEGSARGGPSIARKPLVALLAGIELHERNDPRAAAEMLARQGRVMGKSGPPVVAARQGDTAAVQEYWTRMAEQRVNKDRSVFSEQNMAPAIQVMDKLTKRREGAVSRFAVLTEDNPEVVFRLDAPTAGPPGGPQAAAAEWREFGVIAPPGEPFTTIECTAVANDASAVVYWGLERHPHCPVPIRLPKGQSAGVMKRTIKFPIGFSDEPEPNEPSNYALPSPPPPIKSPIGSNDVPGSEQRSKHATPLPPPLTEEDEMRQLLGRAARRSQTEDNEIRPPLGYDYPLAVHFRTRSRGGRAPVSEIRIRATFLGRGVELHVGKREAFVGSTPPLEITAIDVPREQHARLEEAVVAPIGDGRLLMAFPVRYRQACDLLLTSSRDGRHWEPPWEFQWNAPSGAFRPWLFVSDGVVRMLYLQDRFQVCGLVRDGKQSRVYPLWSSESRDGQEWTPPVLCGGYCYGWEPQYVSPLLRGGRKTYGFLDQLETVRPLGGDGSLVITGLKELIGKWPLPPDRFHGTGSQAAVDEQSRSHLVFWGSEPKATQGAVGAQYQSTVVGIMDTLPNYAPDAITPEILLPQPFTPDYFLGLGCVYYSPPNERGGRLSPLKLFDTGPKCYSLRFVMSGDRMLLIYIAAECVFLRAVLLNPDAPKVGRAVPLRGLAPQDLGRCFIVHRGRVYMPIGGPQPRMLQGNFDEAFRASLPDRP